MRGSSATEKLVTLTKQMNIGLCEPVRVNWQTAKTATEVTSKHFRTPENTSKQARTTHRSGGLKTAGDALARFFPIKQGFQAQFLASPWQTTDAIPSRN